MTIGYEYKNFKDRLSMLVHFSNTCFMCYVFRVSFGSSKGSMVETLIYDSPPVQEESLDPSDTDDADG